MKAIITFKLLAESKEEMINVFAGEYREFREVMELANSKGAFGLPPEKVEMRWLLESGRWD